MPAGRSIEGDLEMVQRKIKALADEVNANDAARAYVAGEQFAPNVEDFYFSAAHRRR